MWQPLVIADVAVLGAAPLLLLLREGVVVVPLSLLLMVMSAEVAVGVLLPLRLL